ncbi:MAG: DEAD/DEAH box helicase, partial [Acidobacteriota bacterium]|nr:DEAD/DEAH box helicase [Acidobacteriota bacterium]
MLALRRETHAAYRSEVHLQARVPVEDWTAVLTGRLDGCVERMKDSWLIEEFKSAYLSSEGFRSSGYGVERDRRQLLGYCYLWRRLGHPHVSGALVYVDIATGEELSLVVPYDDEQFDRDVETRLHTLLRTWRARAAARERKATAAERLPFPHAAPRPVQERLMEAVDRAIAQGEVLLAEAPTGSGKTAAALYPAIAAELRTGRQVVFLTSKT